MSDQRYELAIAEIYTVWHGHYQLPRHYESQKCGQL
jgi:hypothetical protein